MFTSSINCGHCLNAITACVDTGTLSHTLHTLLTFEVRILSATTLSRLVVLAVIVRKCPSRWTSVTPRGDGKASLEFRAGMSNGSNLTSHTSSRVYQHLCWSAATVRRINLLLWPLQCLICTLKRSCAAKSFRYFFNSELRWYWNCCEVVYSIIKDIWGSIWESSLEESQTHFLLANINLVSQNWKGSHEIRW